MKSKKILLGLSFVAVFLLGMGAMYGYMGLKPLANKVVDLPAVAPTVSGFLKKQAARAEQVDQIWQDFDKRFEAMQAQMQQQFGSLMGDVKTSFYENALNVTQNEDGRHIYVNIELGDIPSDQVTVDVDGDMIHIKGETTVSQEDKSERGESISRSFSSFSRSFPVPSEARAASARVEKADGKIVIVFDRVSV